MADRFVLLRMMAGAIARKHGCYATWMPKPMLGRTGSGTATRRAHGAPTAAPRTAQGAPARTRIALAVEAAAAAVSARGCHGESGVWSGVTGIKT